MKRSVLFMINGLGLGNSTRCFAVMEHLIDRGVQVHILTSGNGRNFFSDKPGIASLTETKSYFYSGKGGTVSGWGTVFSTPTLVRLWREKTAQVDGLIEKLSPGAVVIDSEYTVFPPRRRGIPVIGINNAEVVVSSYFAHHHLPPSIRSQFWFVEFGDYLFHRRYCDLVLSPAALPLPPRHPKFRRIGLIVRRAFLEALGGRDRREFPSPRQVKSLVFMLSGSIYASDVSLEAGDLPVHIDVVGRDGPSSGNVTYHGKLVNNIDLLTKADALVINGGFSAVSEAILLNKPTFVIPVPGHAEQHINALAVRDLGLGFVADAHGVMGLFRKMYAADSWLGLGERRESLGGDGASVAAAAICDVLGR